MGKKQNTLKHYSDGFTIVELAIVVIIVGILAGITIISYNGIQANAHNATLQSDLHTAANQLGTDRVDNSQYPATIEAANGGEGLSKSEATVYTYTRLTITTYCLQATSTFPGTNTYRVTQLGKVEQGTC